MHRKARRLPILPPQDGYLFLDKAKFPAAFAADVSPDVASFMADSQVPWGAEALGGEITQPAWRKKPSWYLITTEDKMIPPDAQRAMSKRAGSTVVQVKSSHAVYVSHPQVVAHLIEQAARGALATTNGKPKKVNWPQSRRTAKVIRAGGGFIGTFGTRESSARLEI